MAIYAAHIRGASASSSASDSSTSTVKSTIMVAPKRRFKQTFLAGEYVAATTIIISDTPDHIKPMSDFDRKVACGAYGRPKKTNTTAKIDATSSVKLNPTASVFVPAMPEPVAVKEVVSETLGKDAGHNAVCDVLDLLIARCAGKGMKASRWAN